MSDDTKTSELTMGCLTEHQAADYLALSVFTLRSWRQKKRGPAWVKLGARVVYRLSALESFLKLSTTYTPDSPPPADEPFRKLKRAS